MALATIKINSSMSAQDLQDALERVDSSKGAEGIQDLMNLLRKMKGSPGGNVITVQTGLQAASGTVTFAAAQASDTVTVDGVAFTAVASGASGAQFNVGVKASLELQDLTYTAVNPGSAGNSISIEYTDGATAGSEVVSVLGNAISIQIEDGVSTATQIKAAYDLVAGAVALATVAITGTGGNAQDLEAEQNLAGGTGSNSSAAASLVSAINANATLDGRLSASSSNAVVTLTALEPGELGNSISLASSNGSRLAVSGAALSGGSNDGTPKVFNL